MSARSGAGARAGRTRLAALAALAALLALAACGASESVDYRATDLRTGDGVSLDSLAGAPAVLTSWATWCAECDELLSGLQAFAASPAAAGVSVVAVNLDASDSSTEIDRKIADHGLSTELWRDPRNGFRAAFNALGVPTSVVVDRDGHIVASFPGAVDFTGEEFAQALDSARVGETT